MKKESKVIREISKLGLSPKAEELAYQLSDLIDMPVVFLVDSEGDKNYGNRHPALKNQFWVTVKPQTEEPEYERIILANLYRGVQDRRRYVRAMPSTKYLKRISNNMNRKMVYFKFLKALNSFVTTIDAEVFLKEYGICTNYTVRDYFANEDEKRLREYIEIQRKVPEYHWFREDEVLNFLNIGNYIFHGKRYRDKFIPLLRKIQPGYIRIVGNVERMLADILQKYRGDSGEELVEELLNSIVEMFGLENMVTLKAEYASYELCPLSEHETIPMYSFVPEDFEKQKLLIKSIRYANLLISLVQEQYQYTLPVVEVYLMNHDSMNAMANKIYNQKYAISFTTGILYKIEAEVQKESFSSKAMEIFPTEKREVYQEKFQQLTIFFITAHEFAHILNGDCKGQKQLLPETQTQSEDWEARMAREKAADERAVKLVKQILPYQYRFQSETSPEELQNFFRCQNDKQKFNEFYHSLTVERQQEIAKDSLWIKKNLLEDQIILEEAIQFVNEVLR